jgi:DNA-binding transcriptional MerR regulator
VVEGQLQIGQVAARAGVSVDTVRYYERRLLLQRAYRSSGGFRLFPEETVARIRFIKQAQGIGVSLDDIRELLVTTGGAAQCRRVRDLLQKKLCELDDQMKAMRTFRRTLSRHLAACETESEKHGAAADCPVVVELAATVRTREKSDEKNSNIADRDRPGGGCRLSALHHRRVSRALIPVWSGRCLRRLDATVTYFRWNPLPR